MKANEIRIGNLILFSENGTVFTVDGIGETGFDVHDEIENTWIESETFEGIKLTEEWLLKFGFEKVDHIHGYSFYTLHKSKVNKCNLDVYDDKTLFMGYHVSHCKYIHQLQNLFFALTNQELIIKEVKG